jgi:hypothetical protein
MLNHFNISHFDKPFQDNLDDWCLGGPRKTGYTRSGKPVLLDKKISLVSCVREMINIDEVLAKNRTEIERWHLEFLQGDKIDTQSSYCTEYLLPRFNEEQRKSRMVDFLDLFHSIKDGYNHNFPVWVADIEVLEFGFRYFRFDGAHRTCCAKTCGLDQVPACVFKVDVLPCNE